MNLTELIQWKTLVLKQRLILVRLVLHRLSSLHFYQKKKKPVFADQVSFFWHFKFLLSGDMKAHLQVIFAAIQNLNEITSLLKI